jgi:hypothetical protein
MTLCGGQLSAALPLETELLVPIAQDVWQASRSSGHLENRKIPCPCQKSNPTSSNPQHIHHSSTDGQDYGGIITDLPSQRKVVSTAYIIPFILMFPYSLLHIHNVLQPLNSCLPPYCNTAYYIILSTSDILNVLIEYTDDKMCTVTSLEFVSSVIKSENEKNKDQPLQCES